MSTDDVQQSEPSQDEAVDGQRIAAAILSRMDDASQARIMERIAAKDPGIAVAIAQQRFSISDIPSLGPAHVEQLLHQVERRDLLVSLTAADESTKQTILETLTEKARDTVLDELAMLGSVPSDEVYAARHRVLSKAEYLRTVSQDKSDPKDGRWA
jgi:flagellar motor switch protein FliG